MQYFVMWATGFWCIYMLLKTHGVFEEAIGVNFAKNHKKQREKSQKIFEREVNKLKFYRWLYNNVLFIGFSDITRENYTYYITRLNIRSTLLNREYTEIELRGKYIQGLLMGILLLPLFALNIILIIPSVVLILRFILHTQMFDIRIRDEDNLLGEVFIDLYLLIYPKLTKGGKGGVSSVLINFKDNIKYYSNPKTRRVLEDFTRVTLSYLDMYDPHIAFPKVREKYRSALINNFCNISTQALQGIENRASLDSLKATLIQRNDKLLEKRNDLILQKAQKSIYLIYIILFVFVVLNFASELPKGML